MIIPIDFPAPGMVTLFDDDPRHKDHIGTVAISGLKYITDKLTNTENPDYLAVPCPHPGCPDVSVWHVLGGEGGLAQELHLNVAVAKGAKPAAAIARVQARLDAVDHINKEIHRGAKTLADIRAIATRAPVAEPEDERPAEGDIMAPEVKDG